MITNQATYESLINAGKIDAIKFVDGAYEWSTEHDLTDDMIADTAANAGVAFRLDSDTAATFQSPRESDLVDLICEANA